MDRRSLLLAVLAPLAVTGCPEPTASTPIFDQAPQIRLEAGESVNVSVSWRGAPPDDPSLWWGASCGQVMGLFVRGGYLAPDQAGECLVEAVSAAEPASGAALRVIVTSPVGGGAVRWTRHLGSDLDDAVRRLAATPDGGVIALIETWGDLGGAGLGDLDVVAMRLDGDGQLLWSRPIATATREFAGDVAVGEDGVVWVVGTTWGALGGPSAGESDAFLARLAPDGELEWIEQIGTPRADNATGVAIAAGGDVLVAGWTEGDLAGARGGADGFLIRLAPDGTERWARQLGGAGIDFLIGVAADRDEAVVVGTTDGVVAAPSAGGQDWFHARFDADGAELSVGQEGGAGSDRAYGVAARHGGGVLIVGALGADGFVTARSAAGAVDWTHRIETAGEDLAQAVAAMGDGGAVVVGSSTGDVGSANVGFFDAFTRRLGADGAAVWTRRLGSAADDYGWAIARLPDGDVVIGGRTDGLLADEVGLGGDGYLRRLGP